MLCEPLWQSTKSIICFQNDRKCILQVLSRKLNLSNDIDFEEISKKSDGFTGADLQAVLYTAQIMSMEDVEGLY